MVFLVFEFEYVNHFYVFQSVNRLLSSLHATITTHGTGEILCDTVWCIAYLIDHATVDGERVGFCLEHFNHITIFCQIDLLFAQPGLVGCIVALLKSDSIRALTGALRTVGNIITGTDEQTTAILDFGVLEDLVGAYSIQFFVSMYPLYFFRTFW